MKRQATKRRPRITLPSRNDLIEGFVNVVEKARKPTPEERLAKSVTSYLEELGCNEDQQARALAIIEDALDEAVLAIAEDDHA